MKKQLLLILMTLLPMVASADAVEIDGIYYNLVSKIKEAEVTMNSNKYKGNVVIPASVIYDGTEYRVTSIGDYAFDCCADLSSVTIPSSILKIGSNAFRNCGGLRTVHISDLAAWCGIDFVDSGSNPLYYVSPALCLGEMEITDVVIPNGVTSIGDWAFRGCRMTSVSIPSSVNKIGYGTFDGCNSLASVHITDIAAWCNISHTGYYSNPLQLSHRLYLNDAEIKDLIIPNDVTNIKSYVFESCSGLNTVFIPNSVTNIGDCAFHGCSGMTTVNIGSGVTNIGEWAFRGCSNLTSINIPNNIDSIKYNSFSYCESLKSIIIPNSVKYIGSWAFSHSKNLRSLTIGNKVNSIDKGAFASCSELEEVFCLAENIPSTKTDVFNDSYIEYATLYVPDASVNAYKQAEPWKNFKTIIGLNGTIPQMQKCATPTISYGGKKLSFSCATEGVDYVYEIKDSDIKKGYDSEIQLTATYEISVYATKTGYENSDVATATLVWGSASFTETTGTTLARPLTLDTPILIQSNGGVLTIQGLDDGTQISVYSINGTEAGKAISRNGCAMVNTNLQAGSVAIVKVGEKSVKVVVK